MCDYTWLHVCLHVSGSHLSTAMLTRLKMEMLARKKSKYGHQEQRKVPAISLHTCKELQI